MAGRACSQQWFSDGFPGREIRSSGIESFKAIYHIRQNLLFFPDPLFERWVCDSGTRNGIMAYLKVIGIDLYYEVIGNGEPLLLLRGAYGSIETYREFMPILLPHFN